MKTLVSFLGVVFAAAPVAADEPTLEAKGYVVAAHPVQVSPSVGGVLVWVDPRFEEGQAFKQGDVLAKLEDKEYRCDHDRASYAYQAAQARCKAMQSDNAEEIKQAGADLDEARANGDELEKVARHFAKLRESNAASQGELDAAVAASEAAARKATRCENGLERLKKSREARLEAAEAEAGATKAELEKAKWRLDACEIRAPISGVILAKRAEKGDYISPLAFNVASSLCDMADLSDLEVDVKIPEADVAKVRQGQACTIMPDAYANDAGFLKSHPNGYEGKVSRVMPVADRARAAIPVRVRVDVPAEEAGAFLRPDMGAIVSFKKAKKA